MKNNKGYTLIELLVSIAIFSVVMIGIVGIMRSTSVMYRNGHQEVKLQEEAQIAMNQMEEVLIDADDRISTVSSGFYTVNNTDYAYGFKQVGDELFFKKVAAADAGDLAADTNWSLMSECVKSFEINGIEMSAGRTTGDNRVEIVMQMENGDYNYVAKKDVYFRNAIENQTPHLPPSMSGVPAPTPPVTDYKLNLRRYESVNLLEEFGLVSVSALYYSGATDFTSVFSVYDTSGSLFVKLLDTYNTDFGFLAEDSDGYVIEGLDMNGNVIKILITVDKVDFNKGEGVVFLNNTKQSNNGGYVWLETIGLDMRGAISRLSPSSYEIRLYRDANGNGAYDPGETSYASKPATAFAAANLHNVGTSAQHLFDSPAKILCGLAVCPSSGNIIVTQANDPANNAAFFENSGGRVHIQFTLHLGSHTETVDYVMLTNANSVENIN